MADINLISLIDRFNCEDTCREALEQARWPAGLMVCAVHAAGIWMLTNYTIRTVGNARVAATSLA